MFWPFGFSTPMSIDDQHLPRSLPLLPCINLGVYDRCISTSVDASWFVGVCFLVDIVDAQYYQCQFSYEWVLFFMRMFSSLFDAWCWSMLVFLISNHRASVNSNFNSDFKGLLGKSLSVKILFFISDLPSLFFILVVSNIKIGEKDRKSSRFCRNQGKNTKLKKVVPNIILRVCWVLNKWWFTSRIYTLCFSFFWYWQTLWELDINLR